MAPLGAPRMLITSPVYVNNLAWGPPWPGRLQPHLGQDIRRHWLKARSGRDRPSSSMSRLQLLPPLQAPGQSSRTKDSLCRAAFEERPKVLLSWYRTARERGGWSWLGRQRPPRPLSLSAAAASPPPEPGSQLVTALWNWGPIRGILNSNFWFPAPAQEARSAGEAGSRES